MEKIRNLALSMIAMAIVIIFSHIHSYAQTTRVRVGDLFYDISGSTASVTTSDVIPNDCRTTYPSKYTKDIYVIPSHITYEGLEYEVTEIGKWAFAGFRNDLYAQPKVEGATGSTAQAIILPPTIKRIGESAFANCTNLVKMIIPASVESIYTGYYNSQGAFFNTPLLRELIYLSMTPPSGWHATSKTYVPNISKYQSPSSSIKDYSILPILGPAESSFVYSGNKPPLILSSNLDGTNISYNSPILEKNVGAYDAAIDAKIESEYSYETSIIIHYNITPAEIIVSTDNESREYGDPNPVFKVKYEGFVNNETVDILEQEANISTTAKQTSNVGIYPISISGAKANNYTFAYTSAELTILRAPLSAKVKSISREYGNTYPAFSLDFNGLKNGETNPSWEEAPRFSTEANILSPIGEYAVTATAKPKNYSLPSITDGILTITPAKLKVIANSTSRMYYEENPEFTFYYSGFKNSETESIVSNTPVLTTSATLNSDCGKYDITISSISAPNYEIVYQSGTLTVNPRTLNVTTGIYERAYGEDNPAFDLEYEGFVSGENEKYLTKLPYAYTSATNTSSVGSYSIYITGGEATNYNFRYSSGKLNIVKAEQNVIWNQDLTNLAVGQQVELLGYCTSGLPVSYSADNNDICEIYTVGNKRYLDCKREGEFQLRAYQEGNSNYYSSARVSKKVAVGASSSEKPTLTLSQLPVGSVSYSVEWGSAHSFALTPCDGWSINSVSINGEDYTNRIDSNGKFTTPSITKDTKIIISYTDSNAGIGDIVREHTKVLGQENGIRVLNAPINKSVYIYTKDGILLKSLVANNDDMFISLQNAATYIIRIGEFTCKIRI